MRVDKIIATATLLLDTYPPKIYLDLRAMRCLKYNSCIRCLDSTNVHDTKSCKAMHGSIDLRRLGSSTFYISLLPPQS